METSSVMIQSLCVPCYNHCRYCLLSWDGKVEGSPWSRSVGLAERLLNELRTELPGIKSQFSFGYSMEHPDLREAIRTLRRLGSPQARFLQCDGMKMRSETECNDLMRMLHDEQIKELNFTVYGTRDYHDGFAGRKGDYDLLVRMMKSAKWFAIPFSIGIPVTQENIYRIDDLVAELSGFGSKKVFLFIPHEEGRGKSLCDFRLRKQDLAVLNGQSRKLLNDEIYRPEADWLNEPVLQRENKRMILITLRPDNIEEYENRSAMDMVREIETLDEKYYSAFPEFADLAEVYGNPDGDRMYRFRDLFHHYRLLYAREHDVQVYDVTDERQSGSRRY